MIGLKRGTVKLSKYSEQWPILFEEEKSIIANVLGGLIIDIQHVGSTSIPGMDAKPIIDIDIGVVTDLNVGIETLTDFSNLYNLLKSIGYEWRRNGSDTSQLIFAKGTEENRTHYLHVTKYNSDIWKNDLLFRDCLRSQSDWARQYTDLKKELVKEYKNDRETYTNNKKAFIEKVIKFAKNEKITPSN